MGKAVEEPFGKKCRKKKKKTQREGKFPGVALKQQSLFALLPEYKQTLCAPAQGEIPAGIHAQGELEKQHQLITVLLWEMGEPGTTQIF